MDQMRASCDDAEGHLDRTKEASKELLERAGTLREERFVYAFFSRSSCCSCWEKKRS